jgi:phosphomannomutase/phosphoglucomutase
MKNTILKQAKYKSIEWMNCPVIAESLFREYDLRNPMKPLMKGNSEVPASVNENGFRVLGQAFGTYVQQKMNQKKVIVCNDYRYYSRSMAYAFITGLMSTGIHVVDIGTALTPVLYFSQYHLKNEAAAMITASHNDNGWTGLKLANGYTKTFEPEHILEFKKIVYSGEFISGNGSYEVYEGIKDAFVNDITSRCNKYKGSRKLKVAVACGNGGPSEFLPDIIEKLGFDVIKVHCDLDWDFPYFNPNPENLEFLRDLGKQVKENNCDLGIAADGDGDRFGVVDETGHEIFSDRAGLFIARFIASKNPNRKMVIDVKSTGAFALDSVLKENNIDVRFTKTGHSYVKASSRNLDAIAGFEKSGHFFLRGDFGYGYDDACLSAATFCSILSTTDKKVSELLSEQPKSFQSPTMEPHVANDTIKYEISDAITSEFLDMKKNDKTFAGQKIKDIITVNGARVILEDGSWGLVRASSNQPVLAVVIESFSSKKVMYDIFDEIQSHLSKHNVKVEDYDQTLPPYNGE